MRFSTASAALALAGSVAAAPYTPFPLADGFPNPNATGITEIEAQGHGKLPTAAPGSASKETLANFQLIAVNEIFEVAYFTELLHNITTKVPGYAVPKTFGEEKYVIEALKAVIGQEQMHALGANSVLKAFGAQTITPCEYTFPVDNFDDAILLAQTFTDVVLGTLADVQYAASQSNNSDIVRLVGAIIGQEGEQVGFYRFLQGKVPSAQPFLTGSSGAFAFNAISNFIVPGSCPELKSFPLPTFQPLEVLQPPTKEKNDTIILAWKPPATANPNLKVTYVNGVIDPIVVDFTVINKTADCVTVSAPFPFVQDDLYGLTIAAVTNGGGPFASPDAVSDATVFGPGLIEFL